MSAYIKVSGVTLQIPNYVQSGGSKAGILSTLAAAAMSKPRREYRTILRDIDVDAKEGDRIALLGRNGAGKTTLLRLFSGAFAPTRGLVEVHGSVQSLLSLALGFLPEASVRENIFLRAAAMGLSAKHVSPLVEPILEFSGLFHAANHRLATLSSGQRMRLGFATSTCVQHDIMLLDEWFGSGDAEFVGKARARMTDRVDGSSIVVLASHNLKMLRQVCNIGLVIDAGQIVFRGDLEGAIVAYKHIYKPGSQEKTADNGAVRKSKAQALDELQAKLNQQKRDIRQEQAQLKAEREKLDALRSDLAQQRRAHVETAGEAEVEGRRTDADG